MFSSSIQHVNEINIGIRLAACDETEVDSEGNDALYTH